MMFQAGVKFICTAYRMWVQGSQGYMVGSILKEVVRLHYGIYNLILVIIAQGMSVTSILAAKGRKYISKFVKQ